MRLTLVPNFYVTYIDHAEEMKYRVHRCLQELIVPSGQDDLLARHDDSDGSGGSEEVS